MPKIFIKTDMTEMPEGCGECPYVRIFPNAVWGGITTEACVGKGKAEYLYETSNRPEWCPLREEEEI